MNTSDVTIESKINVPFDTLIKALVEAHVNISINSLITALTNANVNIINEKSVDISKNIPVVLKTEIANNYVDVSTGVSPPSTEIVEDNSYLLSSIPQEQSINNDDFSNVIEEALKYIKNRQEPLVEPLVEVEEPLVEVEEPLVEPLVEVEEPLVEVEEQVVEPKEDKPSESIKKPVIEIPSPKAFEPLPEIPPTPRAIQSRVYYQPYLIPRPPPPPPQILHYHHYIIQPIIQPIIQYIPQPVQYLMQQFRPAYR